MRPSSRVLGIPHGVLLKNQPVTNDNINKINAYAKRLGFNEVHRVVTAESDAKITDEQYQSFLMREVPHFNKDMIIALYGAILIAEDNKKPHYPEQAFRMAKEQLNDPYTNTCDAFVRLAVQKRGALLRGLEVIFGKAFKVAQYCYEKIETAPIEYDSYHYLEKFAELEGIESACGKIDYTTRKLKGQLPSAQMRYFWGIVHNTIKVVEPA